MKTTKYSSVALITLALTAPAHASDIVISGAIEVEAGFSSDFPNGDMSDISVATVELGFDSQINDRVTGHLLLLHEDDDTDAAMEVDEANISVDLKNGWSVTAGQMYVPFGNFESNMVSDPLTLGLGETGETAVLLGYEANGLYGSVYVFNGDTIETGDDESIEHTGFSIGYMMEGDGYSLDVGLDYISSLADTDGVYDGLGSPASMTSLVSGTALHAIYNKDALSVIFEYVASDEFDVADLAFNAQGATVSAFNIEAGYGFDWGTAAIGYQASEEALGLGLPETRILFSISHEIFEDTTLSYEHAMDDDYAASDTDGTLNGSGGDGSTSTIQLAVSF